MHLLSKYMHLLISGNFSSKNMVWLFCGMLSCAFSHSKFYHQVVQRGARFTLTYYPILVIRQQVFYGVLAKNTEILLLRGELQ